MSQLDSRIPVTTGTRKLLKSMKRGGETYDELLQNMAEQYDPGSKGRSASGRRMVNPTE